MADRTSDIYGILIDPSAPRVLVLRDDTGNWTLPHVYLPDKRVFLPMVGLPAAKMGELLAADITILRNLDARYSEDQAHIDLVYLLENHSQDWTLPDHAQWLDRAKLDNLINSDHRNLVVGVMDEAESGIAPKFRQDWACPGWFDEAATWTRDRLAERNYVLTAPIKQIKSWGISCLLRAKTDHGDIYFKVASSFPLFGNEPLLLKSLADRYPDYVPAPLAIDAKRRWMLMDDFGKELWTTPTLEKFESAVQRLGQLQVQTASTVDELFAIGCLDRRLDVLASQIDSLLSDDEALSPMTADEIAQIRVLAPRLKSMCSALAQYHVPFALNHGDLHSGNITVDKMLFFDWTDACIAHPFFDLSTLMNDADEHIPADRDQIVNTYLSLWTAYEPLDRLREAWKLAEPLGALHQVVSYQHILATLEPTSKQEFAFGVPTWLRRVIKTMPD